MSTFIKIFFFISIALSGCKTTSKTSVTKTGSDRDKHGCLNSAGYIWSEINKACLRPFELKIHLHNADKTFVASVNVSNDGEKAEVFSKEGYFLMTKKNDSTFVHPKAILMMGKQNWIFSDKKNNIEYEDFRQSLIHNP